MQLSIQSFSKPVTTAMSSQLAGVTLLIETRPAMPEQLVIAEKSHATS